jgi:hypothetical protein
MMSNVKYTIILFLMILAGVWQGCQEEVTEIIEPTSEEVFTQQSPVSDLARRTSLNDGSVDNIIDGASCIMLNLPFSVIVNGVEITIENIGDLKQVEKMLDGDDDDDDDVEILFPVIAKLPDHSEIVLTDDDDLEELAESCAKDGDDDDIECVDFKYPLEINTYDAENQVSDVITIQNDRQLYNFLEDLDDDDFASFKFPITLILSDETEILINNNDDLEDLLENAIDDCDEDDDNDHNDDDVDDSELIDALTKSNWKITNFIEGDENITQAFEGYIFTFLSDGEAQAEKDTELVNGNWESSGDDGMLELELNFGDEEPFDEIDNDWDVLEYTDVMIRLGDDDDDSDILVYERIP